MLILLVMVGLFVSNFAVNNSWVLGDDVSGFRSHACGTSWWAAQGTSSRCGEFLLRQTFLWLFPIVAVRFLFLQYARGEMSADSVALVLLALT